MADSVCQLVREGVHDLLQNPTLLFSVSHDPPWSVTTSVRLPRWMLKATEELAREADTSVSVVLRKALAHRVRFLLSTMDDKSKSKSPRS